MGLGWSTCPRRIRNRQVIGSSPIVSSSFHSLCFAGLRDFLLPGELRSGAPAGLFHAEIQTDGVEGDDGSLSVHRIAAERQR